MAGFSVPRAAPYAPTLRVIPLPPPVNHKVQLDLPKLTPSLIIRQRYPELRRRRWPMVIAMVLSVMILAFTTLAIRPTLLDPLCDDYAWFGDRAATGVRAAARAVHRAVF